MEFSAEQIAGILEGTIVGKPGQIVTGLSKIEEGQEGTLSFLANSKYEEYIYTTKASVVIVNNSFEPTKPLLSSCTLIKVENAYACFAKLLELYNQAIEKQPIIESMAFVSENGVVSNSVYLGSGTVA